MALTRAQIQTAFQNSLGRAASTSEENSFFAVSNANPPALTDAQVYATISNSQEANLNADPVVRFYQAAFGRVPDQAGLDNATDYVRSFGATAQTYQNLANMFTQSQEFTNRFGTGAATAPADAAYVQALYTTILGRQASAAEINAYTSNANGFGTRGGALYAISQSQEAIGISDNAVNGFLQNAAQGQAVYTGSLYTPANGQPNTPTGASFNLTAQNDLAGTSSASNGGLNSDFRFTSGNETVTAGAGTLGAGDVFLDNSTTDSDVLNAQLIGNTGAFTAQNIETINATFSAGTPNLVLTNVTGTRAVNVSGTVAGTVSGVNLQAATTPTIGLNGLTNTLTIVPTTLAGTTGANTAETLNVSVQGTSFGTTAATQSVIAIDGAGGAGVLETLNITSNGTAANDFGLALTNGAALGTVNINGATNATVKVASATISGATVAAAANTGIVTLDIDRNGVGAASTNLTNVSGVEVFAFRDTTAGTDALVATNVASGSAVQVLSDFAAGSTISVFGAGTNAADVLNLTLDNAAPTTRTVVAGLDVQNVETLNLNSSGNAAGTFAGTTNNAITALTGDFSTITITGDTSVALTYTRDQADTAGTTNTVINASGLTGTAGANITANSTTNAAGVVTNETYTITGSANADTIVGGANGNTINAGAGNDTVTGGAGDDTILGGAGNDRLIATLGTDSVTGGEGVDTHAFSNAVATDTGAANLTIITDFQAGTATGADRVELATATVGANNFFKGTAAELTTAQTAASVDYGVIVLTGTAYASADAAENAVAGANAANAQATPAAIVFLNSTTGFAEIFIDPSQSANTAVADGAVFAQFQNITTLTGLSNFDATNFLVA